jgi:flagellum-specific peptidoglycan hydrolase FlgJ
MTPQQHDFLQRAYLAARQAGHVFPEMAACEAALESGFGHSQLATQDRNLFGMKQHLHPIYGTHSLPTREFLSDQWVTINTNWIVYPDWQSCFADRMATLQRLASVYPHYKTALGAGSGTTYVMEVSRSWSTDPERGEKVLAIYDECAGDWDATNS